MRNKNSKRKTRNIGRNAGTEKFIPVKEEKKWFTLRNVQYDDYPYRKRKIIVPDDLTEEIVIGEGYQSEEALMRALRSMRHRKFPKEMWLYDLRYEE